MVSILRTYEQAITRRQIYHVTKGASTMGMGGGILILLDSEILVLCDGRGRLIYRHGRLSIDGMELNRRSPPN